MSEITTVSLGDNERQLIKKCIVGNRQAQSRLYELYARQMLGVCIRYARSREEAEEILQEGFLKVFENLSQFQGKGSLEGWIRRIMVNSAFQKYRTKAYLHPLVNVDITEWQSEGICDDEILARIGEKELLKMVQLLPTGYRLIFNLFVFEGMKHREIAEMLGIAEGTSKSNLSDARVILRKRLDNMFQIAKANDSA